MGDVLAQPHRIGLGLQRADGTGPLHVGRIGKVGEVSRGAEFDVRIYAQ